MNIKRVLSATLVLLIFALLLNCLFTGNKPEKEPVTLKWIMPGPGKQLDSQMVWDEFNKRLKEFEGFENVTVDIEVIPSTDYAQKFEMMKIGKDSLDIIQTYQLDFADEVRNGTFAPLDELIDTHAPNIKKELPEFIMTFAEVDGELYAVPNYQVCPRLFSLRINKKLADKYIDINELRALFKKREYDERIYEIFEELLSNAQKNGELGTGFSPEFAAFFATRHYISVVEGYGYHVNDDSCRIFEIHKRPEQKNVFDHMRDFYEKGYIRKDILTTDYGLYHGKAGGDIIYIHNGYNGEDVEINKDGIEEYVIYMDPAPVIPINNAAGGIAISSSSKHKEEAIKLIELMNTQKGKDLYNLLVYGIEGVHYEKIGEDRIKTLWNNQQAQRHTKYGLWRWIVGNTKMAYVPHYEPENYKKFVFDYLNEGKDTIKPKLIGFKLDKSNIDVQLSQQRTIVNKYNNPLMLGGLENHDEMYEEFMQKLDQYAAEETREEIQRQVDKFLEKNY